MQPSSGNRRLVEIAGSAVDASPAPLRGGPSVAVLPFENMSGDPEQRYFSDGVTEDIITELSRFREIFVIGRSSSFACEPFAGDIQRVARELGVTYVLAGSVRRAGNRLRISVSLCDANGDQIWADRHDGALDDILDVQEEIARRIVGSIAPEIQLAEQARAERVPLADVQAYDLALRAGALITRGVGASDAALLSEGIELARRAVALDPTCLRAYYAIAWGHCRRGAMGFFGPQAQEDFAAADAAALRLCELDERNHAAYAILGHLAMRRRRHDEAIAALRQAHHLNPNDVTTLRWLSWEESNLGMAEEARRHAELSLRLSPRARSLDLGYWALALAAFVAGDHANCIDNAKRAIAVHRRFAGHYVLLAACLAEQGEMHEARETVASVMAMAPGLLESRLAGANYFAVPELAERYTRALRRAAGDLVGGGASSVVQPQEGGISRPGRSEPAPSALAVLTMREREVLRLVAQGLSNSGIASALELSEHTVKRHIANILMKLDLPTRAAAAALAARHGL